MSGNSEITVIIPVKIRRPEEEPWFVEAMASVFEQEFTAWDLVVVNDHSIVPLEGYINRYRPAIPGHIKLIELGSGRHGLSAARNEGVKNCETELFVFLDADDLLTKDALRVFLERYPGKGFAYPSTMIFNERNDDCFVWKAPEYSFFELMERVYFPNACIQKKSDCERIGGWDEGLSALEDWDYWLRAGELGICGTAIPEVLYWYRQNTQGIISGLHRNKPLRLKATQSVRSKHEAIYKGEFPMACCQGRKKTVPIRYIPKPTNVNSLPGESGMVILEYVGRNVGKSSWFGPATGARYRFGGDQRVGYVDIRDARTGIKNTPGLLEIVINGVTQFVEREPIKEPAK